MKIFITGIAGFVGSHFADRLLQKGHEVSGCDNLFGGYIDNVPKMAIFYKMDCGNLSKMKKVLKDVDIVYHCAAAPHEGLSVFSPNFITRNVYQISASAITASIHNNVKRFVYCSSMARYGNNKVPFTEDMVPKPEDPYGIAKVAGEELLKLLSETHGMEYVIVVPHNIIGIRQKYDDPFRNVASIFINRMLQGKQPIIYGDGNQRRCFSSISDVIGCLEALAFKNEILGEIINIGPDEEFVTINELARKIADIIGFDLKPIYVKDRPCEVRLASCSADKARRLLGYRTEYTLEQTLQEMVEWIKMKGTLPFKYHIKLELIKDNTPDTWKRRLI